MLAAEAEAHAESGHDEPNLAERRLEACLPLVKQLVERVDTWLASEKSKLENKNKELQEFPQPPEKIVYSDRMGKTYATREARDQAIRHEVLSGKYDNSNGNKSKAVYQSYIQTNLAQAWEKDRMAANELAVKQAEYARRKNELESVIGKNRDSV